MPLSVLHVAETAEGGVGHVLADLVRAQADAGWRVCVAAPSDPRVAGPVRLSGGTAVHWSPGARPGPGLPAQLRALATAVRTADPDVVHLHSSMAGLCGRLVVRGRRPTLLQPHSWSFFARAGVARVAARAWERAGARWVSAVLCVSEDERRAAVEAGLRARCVVVPNGVDVERFRPLADDERAAARARLGVAADPVVVCVGRLHRQKGQHRLLDAWPAVLASVPDARLVLVGDGPDRTSLQQRRSPRTELLGARADVAEWTAVADVVAQPSTWEGMSLAVLEAMACARSVVATDVAGMRELVGGGTGALVPLDDPAALARALVARLRDPDLRRREGSAGRALVLARHDLRAQRARVLELTASLAGRP